MFIKKSTTLVEKEITPTSTITLALIGDMSNVTVNIQQSDGDGGWNNVVVDDVEQTLDSTNTIKSIFAPMKLNIVKSAGSDCGVDIYQKKG